MKKNNWITALIVAALAAVTFRKKISSAGSAIVDFALSQEQKHFIDQLNPAAKNKLAQLVYNATKAGWNIIITSAYRSFQEQQQLLDSDETHTHPGHSLHNYGLAIDINAQKGSTWLKKGSSKADWIASGLPGMATSIGLGWGGSFTDYDPVHFYLTGYSWNQLLPLTQGGSIPGNQINIA